jgi:hypothetical protein
VLVPALALLGLALVPGSAAARTPHHAAWMATGPNGLKLAVVEDGKRLTAYACDGVAYRVVFSGRAGVRRQRLSADGHRLRLRLRASGWWDELLDLRGKPPMHLTARRSHAAIFDVRIDETGAVTGTAPGGGVLAAQLSGTDLAGALALPGLRPRRVHTTRPLAPAIDGVVTPLPPDRLAATLAGRWRWIVTAHGIVGAQRVWVTDPAAKGSAVLLQGWLDDLLD